MAYVKLSYDEEHGHNVEVTLHQEVTLNDMAELFMYFLRGAGFSVHDVTIRTKTEQGDLIEFGVWDA